MLSLLPLQFLVLTLVSLAWSKQPSLLIRQAATAGTGDQSCSPSMCVAATKNGTTTQYVLSSRRGTPGWMALGFGSQMRGTQMVILWANADGTITLSQRAASGQFEPAVVPNPVRVATLLEEASATSGSVKFAFSLPSNADTRQPIIFAYGATNPDDPAEDATLEQHADYGFGTLDLTKSLSGTGGAPAGGPSRPSPSAGSVLPLRSYERIIIAHAVCCILGFLLFLPAGALLARFFRTFSSKWFMGHWIIQFTVAGPLILIGVALGIHSVNDRGGLHLFTTHKKWGVAIFVLYFLQCALGAVIHWIKPQNSKRRPPQNYLHAILGLTIIGMAMYQVRTGYDEEWPRVTGREPVANTANIVWYLWVVLLPVLYAVGLALLPRQFRQESATKAPSTGFNESGYNTGYNTGNTYRY